MILQRTYLRLDIMNVATDGLPKVHLHRRVVRRHLAIPALALQVVITPETGLATVSFKLIDMQPHQVLLTGGGRARPAAAWSLTSAFRIGGNRKVRK
jgi:hypothetical protein